MRDRKALLVGAEQYGLGFVPLPAVQQDIKLLRTALEAAGYEVEVCSQDVISDAGKLDKALRTFCKTGSADDVRLLYFTGHGVRVDDVDWIIPAGTSRKDATESSNQRVSTDLSKTVAASTTGLVLFIIDACREKEDVPVTKGGSGWGDPAQLERPGEHRFIRFFGCAPDQVCQVLTTSKGGPLFSLFTKALADSISEGDGSALDDMFAHVLTRSTKLLANDITLQPQTPRLSYGELSVEKQDILKMPIFDRTGQSALSSVWKSFESNKLHCLVVLSEHEHQTAPAWGLKELVEDAVAGETGDRIWKSFWTARNRRRCLSGELRKLNETFDPSAVTVASFSVIDALASAESLDTAVRAIAEADLAVFDVTGFEPAIMMLIGIRSASRRGLSICSHGGTWQEGQQLEVPFNIQDLNINSHTPRDLGAGSDPIVERFVHRVETGFSQLSKHPCYVDLPAYDALRELGSEYDASSTIDIKERILVLCSYSKENFASWRIVASRLKGFISKTENISPKIERIIDYGTSQLIWQGLYEQIRRTAACVVDWSEYSPSVFLELGVRLAVSEWGAVQIVDERYLKEKKPNLLQIEKMLRLFNPIPYRTGSPAALDTAANALLQRNPPDMQADYNRIHRVLLQTIEAIQEAHESVADELKRRADALHHSQQGRKGGPQVLFHGSPIVKQDSEKAALEFRIAAWLYLEHRVGPPKIKADAETREQYLNLGHSAINALYDLGDDESIAFAEYIERQLKQLE